MSEYPSEEHRAARLICKGLIPRRLPVQDGEYDRLIRYYRANPAFRATVETMASQLELRVLDVNDHGICLVASSQGSPFAPTLTDLRKNMGDLDRGAMVIVQTAIAAAFYPRSNTLFGPRPSGSDMSVKVADVSRILTQMCEGLREASKEDLTLTRSSLAEGWRYILGKPEASDALDGRPTHTNREGMILMGLRALVEPGLLVEQRTGSSGTAQDFTFFDTPRYRAQLRTVTTTALFQRCVKAISPASVWTDEGETSAEDAA